MKKLEIFLPVLLWFVLIGCTSPEYLNKEDLVAYTMDTDHGVLKEKKTSLYDFKVYNKPSGLLVAQELGKSQDTAKYVALNDKYNDYLYFILEFSTQEKNPLYQSGSQDVFSENLQTLSFRMNQYVNLTTSGYDTIPVLDFVYPRTFGMSRSASLMFVFNREKALKDEYLWFNLKEFGMNTGNQQFKYASADLKQVPKLKLD